MSLKEKDFVLEPNPSVVPGGQTVAGVAGQVTSTAEASAPKTVNRDPDGVERERTPEELERIDQVKKIMFGFNKTVRSFSLYNQNNDAIRKFIQNLHEGITDFLSTNTVLSIRVRPEALYFEDVLIYENANREESISHKLYKDGIKELVFQQGLEKKEIVDFIEILNLNLDQPEFFDEDIVSLMWERDFNHISYFVIEGFSDDLDPLRKEQFEQDIDLILSLVYSDTPPQRSLKSARLSKDDLYQYFKQDSLDEASEALDELDEFKSLFTVSEAEIKNIQKEIENVSDAQLIFEMVEIIIQILSGESDHDNFMKIGDVLVQIMDMLLLRSDFSNATRIIKRLRELVIASGKMAVDSIDERSDQKEIVQKDFHAGVRLGTWVEEIIERVGEEQRVEQVVAALNQGFKGKPSEIFDYIISLNASSVKAIVNLVGEVSNLTHRRLICDAVLIIHEGDVSIFARKLYDQRWFVVSDMLYILGKVGNSDALQYMMGAYDHENPRVRGECIAALRKFPADKSRNLYITALTDPNLQVQLQALRALAHSKDHGAVDQILEVVESKDFMNFPFSAKKRFFMTLAMIEGNELTPYFRRMLRKNRFWLGNFNTEMRCCAAFSLGIIGSMDAVKVLKKFKGGWNKTVRQACKDALIRSKSSGSGGGGGDLILEPLASGPASSSGTADLILEPIKK